MAKAKKGQTQQDTTLPNGYKTLDRAPNWDFEKQTVLHGRRGATDVNTVDRGRPGERDQRSCVVDDDTLGEVTLWESSMLRTLFDKTKEGDVIRVEFLGYAEPKHDGDSPTKKFSCSVAPRGKSTNKAPF
jgi:hypothetical protein